MEQHRRVMGELEVKGHVQGKGRNRVLMVRRVMAQVQLDEDETVPRGEILQWERDS